MSNTPPKTLIIGSDGNIGSHLRTRLEAQGRHVIGTTRRRDRVDDSTLFLDMAGDIEAWPVPQGVTATVLCAGISSVGECADNPSETAAINVAATVMLARRMVYTGSPVFFLSSGHVFDGETPLAPEDTRLSPITEYGRQKADAEYRLSALGIAFAIVRLSNVLTPGNALIHGWTNSLRAGDSITPFSDMTMAPVSVSFASKALAAIIDQPAGRTWQISGEKDVLYADIATVGARVLGASPDLVRPIKAAEAGYSERIRRHTSMDTSRLRNDLGLTPPDVDQTIEMAFADPKALGNMKSD